MNNVITKELFDKYIAPIKEELKVVVTHHSNAEGKLWFTYALDGSYNNMHSLAVASGAVHISYQDAVENAGKPIYIPTCGDIVLTITRIDAARLCNEGLTCILNTGYRLATKEELKW